MKPGSLYIRLLLLSLVTLGLVWALALVTLGRARGERPRPEMDRFIRHYADYLLQDLGPSPDLERASALASATGWKIRWEDGHGHGWSTSPDVPSVAVLQFETRDAGGNWGARRGRYFFVLDRRPGGVLVLLAQHWAPPDLNKAWLILFVLGAGGILFLSFLAARRLAQRFNLMATELNRMLDSRRQLLLDVSHELRTPLTRLNLGLEMLGDETARASLKEDVAEMEAMLAELLEGARLEQAARWQPRSVDLSALVRRVAEELEGRLPGVQLDLGSEPLLGLGDERGLQILVRNLLDNALKYSADQGQAVELRLWQEDGRAYLSVRDHGPGIATAALPHIFEPFYRADASRTRATGGFGLGLHLVQKVALAHGGQVDVSLAPGGGALFLARLMKLEA